MSAVYAKYVLTPFTLRRISTEKSVPKQTRIPIVRVDNFSLVSLCFPVPWFIVLSVWVSAVYPKYFSMPIHPVEFPQKTQFPNKPGFPLSALIILVWYPYVSLFLDLLCYRFECQRFTQNTFQRLYTLSNFHQKKSVPKQTRIPVAQLIILVWYPYVSLLPDLLCNIGLSVSGLHKIRFNACTPRWISQTNQDSHCPINHFTLVSLRFSVPWFIV